MDRAMVIGKHKQPKNTSQLPSPPAPPDLGIASFDSKSDVSQQRKREHPGTWAWVFKYQRLTSAAGQYPPGGVSGSELSSSAPTARADPGVLRTRAY